ncbi:hypothetical protein AVEN_163644-1 [Araneus ventricosus]|uniref:Uncharacterized protein n=1 Tax=Araneus ventricosus TaxID=182803 RepID=A0A4Y2TP16_ARAVE|nr:hypothetical protein AVEN_163644-1 [Araneus ventricosus]
MGEAQSMESHRVSYRGCGCGSRRWKCKNASVHNAAVRPIFVSNYCESNPLRGTYSSGVTGFTTPRYPSDLISLQAFPSPSATTFRFSASFPRRQARELSMRSCRRSVCFLLLMDS